MNELVIFSNFWLICSHSLSNFSCNWFLRRFYVSQLSILDSTKYAQLWFSLVAERVANCLGALYKSHSLVLWDRYPFSVLLIKLLWKIFIYFSALSILSMTGRLTTPWQNAHPQTIAFSPPCLSVRSKFLSISLWLILADKS